MAEQSERSQLEAFRALLEAIGEHKRLKTALGLESATSPESPLLNEAERRLSESGARMESLTEYLESAGWDARSWSTTDA